MPILASRSRDRGVHAVALSQSVPQGRRAPCRAILVQRATIDLSALLSAYQWLRVGQPGPDPTIDLRKVCERCLGLVAPALLPTLLSLRGARQSYSVGTPSLAYSGSGASGVPVTAREGSFEPVVHVEQAARVTYRLHGTSNPLIDPTEPARLSGYASLKKAKTTPEQRMAVARGLTTGATTRHLEAADAMRVAGCEGKHTSGVASTLRTPDLADTKALSPSGQAVVARWFGVSFEAADLRQPAPGHETSARVMSQKPGRRFVDVGNAPKEKR